MTDGAIRVVVIDDDVLVGIALVRLLEMMGYSARAIIRFAAVPASSEADVLLVDAGCIPGDVTRLPADIPSVLMSGIDAIELANLGERLGAAAVVRKPVDSAELDGVLRMALDIGDRTASGCGH